MVVTRSLHAAALAAQVPIRPTAAEIAALPNVVTSPTANRRRQGSAPTPGTAGPNFVPPAPAPAPPPPPQPPADPIAQALLALGQSFGDAFALALGQGRQSTAPDPAKYPKAKDPSAFNGRRRKHLRTWIGENEICFRTSPNLYRSEISKVMFAGSFLEGDAKSWFTDYFQDPDGVPAFMEDWTLFVAMMHHNFGLEDELGAAEEDLRRLVFADSDHATYFTGRFRAIVSNLQGTCSDRTLRNTYAGKLPKRILDRFESAGVELPIDFEALVARVEKFDRAYWSAIELRRATQPTPRSTISTDRPQKTAGEVAPKTTPQPPPNPRSLRNPLTPKPALADVPLTKEGKLTDAERQRRYDTGACVYCGGAGHIVKDCPKRNPMQARAGMLSQSAIRPESAAEAETPRPTARASYIVETRESEDSGKD